MVDQSQIVALLKTDPDKWFSYQDLTRMMNIKHNHLSARLMGLKRDKWISVTTAHNHKGRLISLFKYAKPGEGKVLHPGNRTPKKRTEILKTRSLL